MENIKYEYTKTPLSYQITEYDCGQATFLNALRYLFKRSEIGKGGTSIYAIEFLAQWLNDISKVSDMKMETKIIKGNDVSINNNEFVECLKDGGVAIFSVWQLTKHYVLCTKVDEKYAYIFDPYYLNINYYDTDEMCEIIKDKPFEYNRKIVKERLDKPSTKDFAFVEGEDRAILLIKKI